MSVCTCIRSCVCDIQYIITSETRRCSQVGEGPLLCEGLLEQDGGKDNNIVCGAGEGTA